MIKLQFKQFSRRVVVTGMGMVSPIGNSVQESWTNMQNYKSGIKDLSNEKYAKDLPEKCKIGAPIMSTFEGKKFQTLVNCFINIGYR
jgi:3-oxoacyl-(acyl-carrier-protein) synthase